MAHALHHSVTRIALLTLAMAGLIFAADEQRLALEAKAHADFERVRKLLVPQLREATACIQTQAALLPIAGRELLPVVLYRKGYCALVNAAITEQSSDFAAAAADFEKAIERWPLRNPKTHPPEQAPVALKALAAVAALHAGAGAAAMERARAAIAAVNPYRDCSPGVLEPGFCESILKTGRHWLGWMELRRDNPEAAVRELAGAERTGWTAWAAGRKAFRDRDYKEAAKQYRSAVETWDAQRRVEVRTLAERLSPKPNLPEAYLELGGAQLLAGELTAAIDTLGKVSDARSLFLRARARELAGQTDAALADYNMASRTAFAGANDLASGEAHLYRGILLYRRKDFPRAETEFASALNFEIPEGLRSDASAWRHMAAVASGACGASRLNLDGALASVSPYFPREEARTLMASCPISSAGFRPND